MTSRALLDTNVVSELMRSAPDPRVLAWFDDQRRSEFAISAITRAEIMLGIALLPEGNRKEGLAMAAMKMFDEDLAVCLSFNAAAADIYAKLVRERLRSGRPVSTEDGQIAAIALANGMPLATRNSKDFADIAGLVLHNPWETT